MPQCMLRILGDLLNPNEVLSRSTLIPDSVFVKGVAPPERLAKSKTGGFNCVVSEADELSEQIREAEEFLQKHGDSFELLRQEKSVESKCLDFYVAITNEDVQSMILTLCIPSSVVKLSGRYELDLVYTLDLAAAVPEE